MAPRRQLLLLLSAIALLVTPFALAPREARAATVTFFVDTTADNDAAGGCATGLPDGDCSLRQAIVAANSHAPAADTKVISFLYYTNGAISSAGATFVIAPPRPELPAITANDVQIVAELSFGIPRIQIDGKGASATGQPVGLRLAGDRGLVRGLSMYGFTNSGLEPFLGSAVFISGDQNRVENSWLGIDPTGATPAGKQNFSGVRIDDGGTANVIGGPGGESVANFISGNQQNGVIVRNSSGNFIQNNFIGLTRLSGAPVASLLGNGQYGVQIVSLNGTSADNTIGGDSTGLANIIGGNGQAGILLRNTGTTSTTVQSNFIGIDKLTNTDFGNTGDGILLEEGTSNNVIGGTQSAPLVISGNTGYGIHLRTNGPSPRDNRIAGTVYIGTGIGGVGVNGAGPDSGPGVPNDAGGILVANNVVGTRIESAGNELRIAGNDGPGITVRGTSTDSTTISAALVGVVPVSGAGNPTDALPNTGGGVLIDQARATSVISSTISGNDLFGIRVSGALTTTLTGNFVGPDLARTAAVPNGGPGIELLDAGSSTVFTNTVTGHAQPGLLLRGALGSSVLSNTVTANAGGILLESSAVSPTRVSALTANIVSGNDLFGVRLSDALTTTLVRNYVGLGLTLAGSLPNQGNGIELFGARNTAATDTYVAGNLGAGIVVSGTGTLTTTLNNTVAGLSFGTVGFTASAPNGGPAVWVTGGARNTALRSGTLGGGAADASGDPGVLIEGTSGVTVSLLRIGWVPESDSPAAPALERPFGTGISVTGTLSDVQILTNTLRFNRGAAVAVSGDAQRVTMLGNGLSRNGDAIRLVGTTILTPPRASDPGSRTSPNHDIDPPPVDVTSFSDPLRLRVGDQGVIDGYVITSTNLLESGLSPVSACISCTIQVFRPGPGEAGATPGQGYTIVNTVPLDGGFQDSAPSFQVSPSGRFTRQIVGGVGAPGSQLLLVATDGFGNSSEYAVFPVSTGIQLTSLTENQRAIPGQTVTYTLRLSNTGTLDVTGLSLRTSGTLRDWRVSTDPVTNTIFTTPTALEAGSSRLITVTLTLPRGPNPNVNAGVTDVTTVTVVKQGDPLSQSVRLETTVAPSPVLVVTPTTSLGSARPNETVPHTHVIRNEGNVTVTVGIDGRTVDPVGTTGTWATEISTRSLTLAPGEEGRVRVDVTVPDGAQVNDPQGNPVQAVTFVSATVPLSPTGGFGPVTVNMTDTTRVNLAPDAVLFNTDQEQPGAAGQTVSFPHAVENRSNAPTRFCFVWSTNLGSTVSFTSRTDGFAIDANGCFSLDTTTSLPDRRFQRAEFDAVVLVNRRLLPGDREVVNISLRNEATGELIGSARVVDRVNVVLGQRLPRLWLPLVGR